MPTTARRPAAAVASLALLGPLMATAVLAAQPATGTSAGSFAGAPAAVAAASGPLTRATGFVDVRRAGPPAATAVDTAQVAAAAAAFGGRATVDLDPTTATPRWVARLDGYLTGRSTRAPRDVVLDYVRARLAGFGLASTDLASFTLRRTYVDIEGTTHLDWTQSFDGTPVWGHGLQAAVSDDGRLLAVGGSPMPGRLVSRPASGRVDTPDAAIRAARKAQGDKATPGPRDVAEQVLFVAGGRTHLAWQTLTMSSASPSLTVVDSTSGGVLHRRPLTQAHAAEPERRQPGARGLAFRHYPGAERGGRQLPVNFTSRGWLDETATTLSGNNTHVFSDLDDDDVASGKEEVKPSSGTAWDHEQRRFSLGWASFCATDVCTWNPHKPYSWRKNRKQAATQAFYFVNAAHDHLQAAPIGFTEAAGNFQLVNASGQGLGADAVLTQTHDGADAGQGFPDGRHVDGADMATPPDGQAPTMQLYLMHQPGTSYPEGDPYSPTNAADSAEMVFHEYVHGLSNRLVVDAAGNSTLGAVQAGAMGEAWGDWYAMDYLVASKFQKDDPAVADLRLFAYAGEGARLERTAAIDCPRRSPCGYSYADYGDVVGAPEVHADGEIWGQALWDLRTAVGSDVARSLVTRAMELAPGNPSYLDMRNAMLVADTAVFDGAHRSTLWSVFAGRGMGHLAGSFGGDDTEPAPHNKVPPAKRRTGTLSGTVTDVDTGLPLAGVPVRLAWQGGAGMVNPATTTASDGTWSLGELPRGRYRKLTVEAAGYDPVQRRVRVRGSGGTADVAVRRNWASASGGAQVASWSGPDFSPQCGPGGAIDGSLVSGWASTAGDDLGTPTATVVPKQVTIDLGTTIELTGLAIDPAATCGDGGSASLADWRVETSPDNVTFSPAASGTFTADDRGRLNPVTPTAATTGVRYVRLWLDSNQTPDRVRNCPDGPYAGCTWMDVSELTVYGVPSP